MADVNMDEDVPITPDDMGDLAVLPNLGGLSRLVTDPVQKPEEQPTEQQDTLGDLVNLNLVLPNLKGLSRLQTDPAQIKTITPETKDTNTDLPGFDVPNLKGLSRLQTDPIINTYSDSKTPQDESTADLELIPVFKFIKTPKVIQLLENGIDSDFINWDIFAVHNIASHYTLSICTKYLFNKLGLFSALNINENKLLSFVSKIESGYLDVPYHGSLHATDVMINSFHFLIKTGLIKDDLDKMIVLIAALCHDYKHPGLQPSFLSKTKHEIAIKYKDKSILEQMHIAESLQILKMKQYNFLENMEEDKVEYVRKCINDMILATDMAFHGDHVKKLEEIKDCGDEMDKMDVMKIGLHSADLGAVCKTWELFEEWGKRIFLEWFLQGDKEKELGIKVTEYMDIQKDSDRINERHSEFITCLMLPFFEKWCSVFEYKQEFQIWYKQLRDNNDMLKTKGIKL